MSLLHGAPLRLRGSALFLRRGLRHPQQICSVMPSSPGVGRAMARAIAKRPAPGVIELGAGSGPVTRALLANGVSANQLVAVELDPTLASYLHEAFPAVEVLNLPAQSLSALWSRENRAPVGGVVSTLPLKIMDEATVDAVIETAFDIMAPGGRFVQFTYRFASPVRQAVIDRFGLSARRAGIVWPNLPPAAIWVYWRAGNTAR